MKNNVVANASFVTVLSVFERGLGFLYRIVLSRLLGAEGLGLYQVALSVFALFLTLGTGGLPVAISRTTAAYQAQNKQTEAFSTLTSGICLSLLFTLPFFIFLQIFGKYLGILFTDAGVFSVFRILLLGLCLSSAYSAFRGYFWGKKNFVLPAVLDIVEETIMVIFGVCFLQNLTSPQAGAEKAAWAVVISYFFSFTISLAYFFIKGGKFKKPKNTLKPLFNATLPITSVRAGNSLINSAVAVLFPAMLLKVGFSQSDALQTFGVISGMVLPILFIPATLIGSLSLVLIPELSQDLLEKNYQRLRKNILRSLRFALLVACTLIPFFYALGEDIGKIAFSNAEAGAMIRKSCPVLLPMCLAMISTSMLNSLGYEKHTFLFYFIGAAAMLLSILFLPNVFGGYAYVVGLGASFVLTGACNLVLLFKKCNIFQNTREQISLKNFFLPLIAILPLSLAGQFFSTVFKGIFGEITAFLLSAICLFAVLFLTYFLCGILPINNKFRQRRQKIKGVSKNKVQIRF